MQAGPSEHGYDRSACYVNGRRARDRRASERCVQVTVRLRRGCTYRRANGPSAHVWHTTMRAGPSDHGYDRSACYVNGLRASEHRASKHCVQVTVRLRRGCAYHGDSGARCACLAYRRAGRAK